LFRCSDICCMMEKWKQYKLMDLKYNTKQEIKITSKVQI